jgi:hypothetical protein
MAEEKGSERFWRRRPVRVAQERALATSPRVVRRTEAEHSVIAERIAKRRFEQAKGRIRPDA